MFGVPLQVAIERNPCHDGIQLPVIVRECIDYVEERGMTMKYDFFFNRGFCVAEPNSSDFYN